MFIASPVETVQPIWPTVGKCDVSCPSAGGGVINGDGIILCGYRLLNAGREGIKYYRFFDIMKTIVDDLALPVDDLDDCTGIEEHRLEEGAQPTVLWVFTRMPIASLFSSINGTQIVTARSFSPTILRNTSDV